MFFSGLSPFLDDSDDETTSNILRCDYSFPSEYFLTVSNEAKDLIRKVLFLNPGQRMSASDCLQSAWLKNNNQSEMRSKSMISSIHLCTLVRRRMKKLNSVVPVQMTRIRLQRPESLYRKQNFTQSQQQTQSLPSISKFYSSFKTLMMK